MSRVCCTIWRHPYGQHRCSLYPSKPKRHVRKLVRQLRRITIRMSHYYKGPASDHFDGVRFFDPHGPPPRSRRDLLRWFVDRHWRATKAKWPAWATWRYGRHSSSRHRVDAFFLLRTLVMVTDDISEARASATGRSGLLSCQSVL